MPVHKVETTDRLVVGKIEQLTNYTHPIQTPPPKESLLLSITKEEAKLLLKCLDSIPVLKRTKESTRLKFRIEMLLN